LRISVAFSRFPQEFEYRCLGALLCDIGFKHHAFVIHGELKVVRIVPDVHEFLIQIPSLSIDPAHRFRSPFAHLIREICSKAIGQK
jgi:hypothetical protein